MKLFKLLSLNCVAFFLIHSLSAQTTTFNFTGSMQSYVVPAGVTELNIDVLGAKGGDGGNGIKPGGTGGRVRTTLTVSPGQTLYIYVGGIGFSPTTYTTNPINGGFNGGGSSYQWAGSGGGASDIRIGGTTLSDRVVVAGGGGGAGDDHVTGDKGGNGGDLIGANGEYNIDPNHVATGKGGSQVAGGIAGDHASLPPGTNGAFGIGGDGCITYSGAGGGGGYYGGGGGSAAGAGGGSSYTDPSLTSGTIHTQGFNSGAGQIVITEICSSGSPIPDVATLSNLVDACSVSAPVTPTATNCSGTFNGTPDVTFPITAQGTTTITWTYDDGNGNTSTQTQDIVIDDITAPVADVAILSNVISECSVTSLTAPTATDNCTGTITGTHNATLPITVQGTTTVTWTYDDGNGNTSTQTQNVVIDDVTAPVADVATLSNITSECSVSSLTTPTAVDNCVGSVTGTHNVTLPITVIGTTTVTWTYEDGNGNTSTQTQNVVITPIDNGITQVDAFTLSADASGYNYQWVDCNNGNQAINGETNQTFVATSNGNYAVEIDNGTCSVTSNCLVINQVGILEFGDTELVEVYPNPTSGVVTISGVELNTSIEIYNSMGELLQSRQSASSDTIITLSEYSPGVYYVKLKGNSTEIIQKIIKY